MKRFSFLGYLFLALFLGGCSLQFNFTGVPKGTGEDGLETIFIGQFGNEADLVVPLLAQSFTEALQDRFNSQSRLNLVNGEADVNVSGTITRYQLSPVAISGDEVAEQNRLTIAVRVNWENTVTPEDSWEQTFSSFVDFDADLDFTSIEQEKIDEISEQLTQDIFNKSLGEW